MGFLTSFVKNGEIRPSLCYKIILVLTTRGEKSTQFLTGTTHDLF